MIQRITEFTSEYLSAFRVPHVGILDILEILILTFLIYQLMIMIAVMTLIVLLMV